MSNNYNRYNSTQEQREDLVIKKGNVRSTPNKMTEYLSQDNVKNFNRIVISKNFDKLHEKKRKGKSQAFDNYDQCLSEVEGYFKLCDQYDIIPTIASLALYLGIHRDTIYTIANNPKIYDYSDVMKSAIATCQGYHEQAFLSNQISPVAFIFYGKNYYNLKDTTDVRFNQNDNDTTINSDSMIAIKEQIANEQATKYLE